MNEQKIGMGQSPRENRQLLWDLESGLWQFLTVLVAHDLKLFALLAKGPQTVAEICAALPLASHPAQAILNTCMTSGLVLRREEGARVLYELTPAAADYLVENSPMYYGKFLDLAIANPSLMTFDGLKQAILSSAPQVSETDAQTEAHADEVERGTESVDGMHGFSAAPAHIWPGVLDLSRHQRMLDIGGGSGVHAIAAVQRWPALEAIVLEFAMVCKAAEAYIARSGLKQRIRTHVGDMWKDPYPSADLHFYSWIFHCFTAERGSVLIRKSFASLPPGGRIIVHEMLYNDDRSGPAAVATLDVVMLNYTQGQEYSGRELCAMLEVAGFVEIQVKPTYGYWSIVTGVKPG